MLIISAVYEFTLLEYLLNPLLCITSLSIKIICGSYICSVCGYEHIQLTYEQHIISFYTVIDYFCCYDWLKLFFFSSMHTQILILYSGLSMLYLCIEILIESIIDFILFLHRYISFFLSFLLLID